MAQNKTPFLDFWKNRLFLPFATLVVAIVAGILCSLQSPAGMLKYSSHDVLQLVVPIAGTIVALALPAAQLAQSVTDSLFCSADGLFKDGEKIEEIVQFLKKTAAQQRKDLDAMKWVVMFSLGSLLIGLAGVLGLFSGHQIFGAAAMEDLFASLSVSFLVTSVLWFLPVVNSSFDFTKADELIDLFEHCQNSVEGGSPSCSATSRKLGAE